MSRVRKDDDSCLRRCRSIAKGKADHVSGQKGTGKLDLVFKKGKLRSYQNMTMLSALGEQRSNKILRGGEE